MKRKEFLSIGFQVAAGCALTGYGSTAMGFFNKELAGESENDLYKYFKNPDQLARPFVRWWWNGIRITKDEIIRELDVLKKAGIGGVEINAIAFPDQADPVNYEEVVWLSSEWGELVKFAVSEAKKRNIICDIIAGSGWPFGGGAVKKEDQTQMMALGVRTIKGPLRFEINTADLLKEVEPKVSFKNPKQFKELFLLRLCKEEMTDFDAGEDLDGQLSREKIIVDIPEGNHVLYYLVKIIGFEQVVHGSKGVKGPVINHYDKRVVANYLNSMSEGLARFLKPETMSSVFRSVFVDSFELEGANWCDDMQEEFEKRRGYSLRPYLPFILFKVKGHGFIIDDEEYGIKPSPAVEEMINNVRFDFEKTRIELFNERFYQPFLDWCRRHGVKSRVQAYGLELHPVDGSLLQDLPECETWIRKDVGESFPDYEYIKGRGYRPVNKLVTSAARLAGKKYISCEDITNTDMVFNEALQRIKVTGDQSMLAGITHSILHGFNYSPPDAPFPGWVRYGTYFSDRNPLWPYFSAWFAYKARLSAVFQRSVLFADIAVLLPFTDVWKKYGADWYPRPQKPRPFYAFNLWEAIHQNGNGCDMVSEAIIAGSEFENGKMTYQSRTYKYLILVETEALEPSTAEAIARFVAAGGKVICLGNWPQTSAGTIGYSKNSRRVNDFFLSLGQQYPANISLYPAPARDQKIIDWYRTLQAHYDIRPYMQIKTPLVNVNQIYYQAGKKDIFFIANYSLTVPAEMEFTVDIKDKFPWIWDSLTGEKYRYPFERDPNRLKLSLAPGESQLLVFDKQKAGPLYKKLQPGNGKPLTVTGPWNVTLKHVQYPERTLIFDSLKDFKEDSSLVDFAGTILYTRSFDIADPKAYGYIDLGKVYGVSEIFLNGKSLGVNWHGNPVFDLKEALVAGKNTLVVQVVTTLGNYMKSIESTNKTAARWMKNQPLYSQGLIGPVKIM